MAATLDGEPPNAAAAAAAINGNDTIDTIVLQASPFAGGPRIKRLKTEHPSIDPGASYHTFQNGHTIPPARRASLPDPTPPAARRKSRGKSLSRENTQTLKSPSDDAPADGPVLRKTKIPSLRLRLSQAPNLETQSLKITSATKGRNIDFRAAPSDTTEFAWWIAQQVRQTSPREGPGNDRETALPGFGAMVSVMRPLEAPPTEEDPELVKEKEREKQRIDNRERKKRWREINAERNKDNDLRCRVTKLAKNKYGEDDTEEKLAFIEREFESRRAKRAEKEKRNASYRGTISAFRTGATSSKELKDALRMSLKNINKKSVETAAAQLIEIVVDAAGQQLNEQSLEMAKSLQTAIASGATDVESVEEAARLLAGSEDLKRAFEEGPDRKDSAEPDSVSIEGEDQTAATNGHMNGTGLSGSPGPLKKPVDNLNAAVQTLNGIGRAKKTASTGPGRRRKDSARVEKARTTTRRKGKKLNRLNTSRSSATKRDVDTTSIDAILMLANGGSIFNMDDDDDDETVADPEEVASDDLDFMNATTDEALNAVLERVATRIVRDRVGREALSDPSSAAANSDAKQTHAVREQVLKMKAFVSDAGVGVNTLVPSTEAQALSELYAQLRKYIERERTPPQEAATLFRTTGWSGFGTNTGGARSETDAQRPPSSHRSAEEQRNILNYGFPPLPGHTFVPRRI